jgi:single-strand DNA-binding protein
VEKTTWVKCAYWTDKTAIAQYLKKGQMVYAEGIPEAEGYLNKENQNAASLKMRVMQVQLLGSNKNENQGGSQQQNSSYQSSNNSSNVSQAAASQVEEPADDLPF